MKINRYPGVKPFQRDEQILFFGRAREIRELCDLVRVEQIVVLFGKSGYGKSSLLNAGVLPQLASVMQPIEVRFGEYIPGQSLSPLEAVRRRLDDKAPSIPEMAFLDSLDAPDSLWLAFKKRGARPMLLVFDQFEEFFSYPLEQQQAFKRQLADLLDADLPDALREIARTLPREQRRMLAAPPNVRALFAIRSDRMSDLDRLKDQLPAILHKRFELRALTTDQAREAIIGPARLINNDLDRKDVAFNCPAFDYRDDALQYIVSDLSRSNTNMQQQSGVEAFQLQILCDTIEELVRTGQVPDRDNDGCPEVCAEDLPDFTQVYSEYYERRLDLLPEDQRTVARQVIEDGLVRIDPVTNEGRRMSVDGEALLQVFKHVGLTTELLRLLENTFLIRREPNNIGGYNYEISHDTLLGPITKAAQSRHELEENQRFRLEAEEAQRREAEALAREHKANQRRRQAVLLAWGAAIAAILALISMVWALDQTEEANLQREQKSSIADSLENTTIELSKAYERADSNWRKAKKAEDSIFIANILLVKEKYVTENQRDSIKKLLAEALLKTTIAENAKYKLDSVLVKRAKEYVKEAKVAIKDLNYERANDRLSDAYYTYREKQETAKLLLELGYFYSESGFYQSAFNTTSKAATLLENKAVKQKINATQDIKDTVEAIALINQYIYELNEDWFAEYEARYFPVFELINEGNYDVKDSVGSSTVPLKSFYVSNTEISLFQYNLFLASSRRSFNDFDTSGTYKPWAKEGGQPVKNINWFDAILYANWLSSKQGKEQVYQIDTFRNTYEGTDEYMVNLLIKDGFRLLTDIEWQYAALKGFEGIRDYDDYILHKDNSKKYPSTNDFNSKKADANGLFNMFGSLWEWCDVHFRDKISSNENILLGGSWIEPFKEKDVKRGKFLDKQANKAKRDITFGFRLCRSQ